MDTRWSLGYGGAALVLLAAYASVVARWNPSAAPPGPASWLPVLLLAGGWRLAARLSRRADAPDLASILSALGHALLPLGLYVLAWPLAARQQAGPQALASAALLAWLWSTHGQARRAGQDDRWGAWFAGLSGGLLVVLLRLASGLTAVATLALLVALSVALAALAPRLEDERRRSFCLAALALAGAAQAAAAVAFWPARSAPLLDLVWLVAGLLALAAAFSRPLGPVCRWFGGTALAALTVAATATLRAGDASPAAYLLATSLWMGLLAAVSSLREPAWAEPFHESAHWLVTLLALGVSAASLRSWWPLPGLEHAALSPQFLPWLPAARWDAWPLTLVAPLTLVVAAGALAAVAARRQRHPPIAASLAGLAFNVAFAGVTAWAAPLLLLLAAGGLWTALGGPAGGTPFVPPVLGTLFLALADSAERVFPAAALRGAGYTALLAALSIGIARGGVAILLAVAAVFLWRSLEQRALAPHLGALAAASAAGWLLARGTTEAGDGAPCALALLACAALGVYRLMLVLEEASLRSGLVLAWACLAGGVALAGHLRAAGDPVATPAVLWLGLALGLAGPRARAGRREYEPVIFLGDWIETALYLLAHAAGAVCLIREWLDQGLPFGDAGPLLGGWAWAHLALHRRLAGRARRRSATTATGIAASAFSLLSVALPSFSSSREVAVAALLMNAALCFYVGLAPDAWARRARRLGHALNLAALALAASAGPELCCQALLAAAAVFLWRSLRTRALAPHLGFLVCASGAALVFGLRAQGAPAWTLGLLTMACLLVFVALLATQGRTDRGRATLAWALATGVATALADAAGGHLAPAVYLALWLGFLLALEPWDTPSSAPDTRPDEPEDQWLGWAGYAFAHLAGAAWWTSEVRANPVGPALGLALWSWLHLAVSSRLEVRAPARLGTRATAAAVPAFGLATLVLAAGLGPAGPASALACVLAGALFVTLRARRRAEWLGHAAAWAAVEAAWLAGGLLHVTREEWYLTPVLAYLYWILHRPTLRPRADAAAFDEPPGSAWIWRPARRVLAAAAILAVGIAYPLGALLRSGDPARLFFLGLVTLTVVHGFPRDRPLASWRVAACAALLAGTLALGAKGALSVGLAAFLAAVGLLLLAGVGRTPARVADPWAER